MSCTVGHGAGLNQNSIIVMEIELQTLRTELQIDEIYVVPLLYTWRKKSSRAKVSVHQLFSDELPDEDSKNLRNKMRVSVSAWRLGVASYSPNSGNVPCLPEYFIRSNKTFLVTTRTWH